jgi:tripartite-type tricarboxylate transporter receptor subunit TctC
MPEVPASVPLVRDFVSDEDDRRALDLIFTTTLLAKPFIAPPEIPADRVQALRDAFMLTMRDPEFVAEMEKAQASTSPMPGDEMQRIINEAYNSSEAVIRRVREALAE